MRVVGWITAWACECGLSRVRAKQWRQHQAVEEGHAVQTDHLFKYSYLCLDSRDPVLLMCDTATVFVQNVSRGGCRWEAEAGDPKRARSHLRVDRNIFQISRASSQYVDLDLCSKQHGYGPARRVWVPVNR